MCLSRAAGTPYGFRPDHILFKQLLALMEYWNNGNTDARSIAVAVFGITVDDTLFPLSKWFLCCEIKGKTLCPPPPAGYSDLSEPKQWSQDYIWLRDALIELLTSWGKSPKETFAFPDVDTPENLEKVLADEKMQQSKILILLVEICPITCLTRCSAVPQCPAFLKARRRPALF